MQRQQQGHGSGFLITCDKNKEKLAIKDAFNFINEYIEDIYGDIESALIEKQLAKQGKDHNLKSQMQVRSSLKNKLKLLSSVDTNVNCLVFIKINEKLTDTKIDPYAIVNAIMKDIHKQDREVTRFCHKIMPVQRSFKAEHFRMLDQIDSMFQGRDNSEVKSWALNFKCRNNSKFNYKEILGETEKIAKKYGHFVDIYYPQWTLAVEIVHHLMCLSIVEGYKEYDEFRLHKKGAKRENIPRDASSKPEAINQKRREKEKEKEDRVERVKQEKVEVKTEKKEGENEPQSKQQPARQEKSVKVEIKAQSENHQQQNKKANTKLLQQKIQINDQDVDFI